jgi:hypothetical protein
VVAGYEAAAAGGLGTRHRGAPARPEPAAAGGGAHGAAVNEELGGDGCVGWKLKMKVGYRILIGRLQNSSVEKIQNTRLRCRQALLVSSDGIG